MHRRSVLVATGGMLAVAGCVSNGEAEEENGEADDEAEEASAEIVETEIVEAPAQGTSGEDVVWLQVDVENPTTAAHGGIRLESTVIDEEGEELLSETHLTSYLPAETTLRYYHRGEFPPEDVDDFEVDVTEAHPAVRASELEDVSIESTELSAGGDLVNVQGEAEVANNDELDRIMVIAPIYDEAGYLRGTGTATEYNPEPTFEFGADSSGFRAPHVAETITDYDVFLFDDLP